METNHMPLKIRCVGVTLHDNDFGLLFQSLLENLKELSWLHSGKLTEDQIKHYILDAIPLYYKHFQCMGKSEREEDTIRCLTHITKRFKIYFNEAAEEMLAKADHNSEYWHWDFTLERLFTC
jgi:hypothetical protein